MNAAEIANMERCCRLSEMEHRAAKMRNRAIEMRTKAGRHRVKYKEQPYAFFKEMSMYDYPLELAERYLRMILKSRPSKLNLKLEEEWNDGVAYNIVGVVKNVVCGRYELHHISRRKVSEMLAGKVKEAEEIMVAHFDGTFFLVDDDKKEIIGDIISQMRAGNNVS